MKPVVVTILFGILCLCPVYTTTINITLANYHPYGRNIFKHFYEISEDRNEISISNIHDQVGFLIVQVHSYLETVTLSNTMSSALHSYVTGKNIGLIWSGDANTAIYYLLRNNKIQSKVQIMIAITVYDETAPIPGGCNMSFDTLLAPYQLISYNYDYRTVKSQAPSAYGISCDDNKVEIEMYHLFLNEHDATNASYFDGIEKMLGVDEIKINGFKVHKDSGYFKYNRLFSNYRGTGSVYAIIATYNNRSSAYVPAVSYGCDETDWIMDCIGPATDQWKIIISLLFLFGTFICFYGHKFFRFTLVMVGFTFGVFITYCIVSTENASSFEMTMTSVCMGSFYGIFWAFIWWKFGVPILSVHLAILLSGCLLASNVFYTTLADCEAFTFNWNYWLTFLCIVISYLIIWIPVTMHAHIFACSYLGSYAFITALNYYVGGNLQYIVINTYRRISVENFNFAVIDPPFQFTDGLYCILWIVLMCTGFHLQLREQKQRPPFPPNRRAVVNTIVTERTPLIRPEIVAPPEYV